MIADDARRDPVLAAVSGLPPHDVDDIRAHRLRARCRAALRAQHATAPARTSGTLWRRTVGPALVATWCALYLLETVRRAAAIYGF